ncbi:MAG TPA: XdhC family protein, partial [Nevskiaceae bacterium]|nr:XdhC family protein [Nevskiaceae bacterium]
CRDHTGVRADVRAEAFWRAVLYRLDVGVPVFVAIVVANTHGSPGTPGARILVDAEGSVEGTIGGGIMEANLVAAVHRALASSFYAPPSLERLVHRKKAGTPNPSGLICAGEQTNLKLWLRPGTDTTVVRAFYGATRGDAQQRATLEVDADGLRMAQGAAAQLAHGSDLRQAEGGWCYRESSVNPRRLTVVGGGHCGKALTRLALDVGYSVDVFDTRGEVLDAGGWPDSARRHLLASYDDLGSHLAYPELTTVVVMTTAVTQDIAALAAVAGRPVAWLGVMGSAAKIHEIRGQLTARGLGKDLLESISGPIGLKMKSDTPAEIAVSIMAEILARDT